MTLHCNLITYLCTILNKVIQMPAMNSILIANCNGWKMSVCFSLYANCSYRVVLKKGSKACNNRKKGKKSCQNCYYSPRTFRNL